MRGIFGIKMIDEKTLKEINTCPPAKNAKEEIYILKRRIKAFLNSLCFYMCRIFPIKRKLVSVCTFEGKGGFGCNPKYIVQELHKQDKTIEFVWFVNQDVFEQKEFPDYIKKVPNTLWSRAYWLSRSKVWIDNYRKPYGTVKRKGQYYINTWHANIGFKSIGLTRGTAFSKMAYLVSKNDSDMIDKIITDSDFTNELFRKGLLYSGDYIKAGQCRCDILHGDREKYKEKIRDKYSLPHDSHIIMYAPTFREKNDNGKRSVYAKEWGIDFNRLLQTLERKYGGEWILCVRLHPQLATDDVIRELFDSKTKVIDASLEDDMYEILAGMDAFITDYSSAALDASYSMMPVFIYADDLAEYSEDRGNLLWDLLNYRKGKIENNKRITPGIDAYLPYALATNNDELEKIVMDFNDKEYKDEMHEFAKDVGLVFDGNASKIVSQNIIDYLMEQ